MKDESRHDKLLMTFDWDAPIVHVLYLPTLSLPAYLFSFFLSFFPINKELPNAANFWLKPTVNGKIYVHDFSL